MTRTDAAEAAAVLRRLLAALGQTATAPNTDEAATLRQRVGALSDLAETKVKVWRFGAELAACFQAATEAGATFIGLGRVAGAARAEQLSGVAGKTLAAAMVRYAIAEQAVVLSLTAFASRNEAERALSAATVSFGAAADYAAEQGDTGAYRAIVALEAAVVRDLGRRSRQLPRVVSYGLARSFPALTLANRFYGDAGRADEIVAENSVFHPLFLPRSVTALSA